MPPPSAFVYVDGFNLYRQALINTPYKWLNPVRMSELLFGDFTIQKVRYFTAQVKHQPHNPQGPQRQQRYWRALRTEDRIAMHLGHFRIDQRSMPIHPLQLDSHGRPVTVRVRKIEEKGSDVNLATHLLADAFHHRADIFIIVSNDSDLAEPLRLLTHEYGRVVGLVTPGETVSHALRATSPRLLRRLRKGVLRESQFPHELRDEHGMFRMPREWEKAEASESSEASRPVAEAPGGVNRQ